MAIYALGDRIPEIDDSAYVHPDATVIGSVQLGPQASVWPQAVLRGDYGRIIIGEATNVQDGAVIHATRELTTVVGAYVTIGHLAHLEGCTIEDRALIGVGSSVLHRAVVGTGATVGAGAVVMAGTHVAPGALAVGVPAVIKPDRSSGDSVVESSLRYVANADRFRRLLRRLD